MKKTKAQIIFKEILSAARVYIKDIDEKQMKEAFDLMEKSHKGQFRGSGDPYATHPAEVVKILTSLKADQDTLIAGFLHDVPEDTNITLQDVENQFGENICLLVDGVTKLGQVDFDSLEDSKAATIKKMFLTMEKDKRVLLIKLADRLHNTLTLKDVPLQKQKRVAKETLDIYVPLASLFGVWKIKHPMEDICMQILFPEEHITISKKLNAPGARYVKNKKIIVDEITKQSTIKKIPVDISTYDKSIYSVYKKIIQQNLTLDTLHDTQTLRFVTDSIDNCYVLLGIIHNLCNPRGKFKDYIAVPKRNQYQSIHTTVFGPTGIITEIQIRTDKMQDKAERGVILQQNPASYKKPSTEWIEELTYIVQSQKIGKNFTKKIGLESLQKTIFVFTPEGEIINIKKGATPLDFAYAIHSRIGNKYSYAKINGKVAGITNSLVAGDVIDIITEKKNNPKIDWLDIVKTNFAKRQIKKYFRKFNNDKKEKIGRVILENKMKLIGDQPHLSNANIKLLLNHYKKERLSELYQDIGSGEISISEILDLLYSKPNITVVNFIDKLKFYFSNIFYSKQVSIKFLLEDRVGLLADVTNLTRNLKINITKIMTKKKLPVDAMTIEIEINNPHQLYQFCNDALNINGIIKLQRISEHKTFVLKIFFLMNIFYWITQPFILTLNILPQELKVFHIMIGMFFALFNTFLFQKISKNIFSQTNSEKMWKRFLIGNISIIIIIIIEEIYFKIVPFVFLTSFIIIFGGITITEFLQFYYNKTSKEISL